jgi:hypothetical protein
VVLLGREGLGLSIIAVDGDAEVVARRSRGPPRVGRVYRYRDLGLLHNVALGSHGRDGKCALDGRDGSEDGGSGGIGEEGSRSSGNT